MSGNQTLKIIPKKRLGEPRHISKSIFRGRHGCDRMVVGFTITYAIGAKSPLTL
jgi:hypothetical protein